jgi:TolA-binding protein
MTRTCASSVLVALALAGLAASGVAAPLMTKPQVANLISRVENGVDEFRNYLERRGDNARNAPSSPQAENRRSRHGTATESQKTIGQAKKDDLDDALSDLNRSTNRLKRKFNATQNWMETKAQVERVLEDGRKVNQAVLRGSRGSEVARLWAALRTGLNDLARAYGCIPLAR